MSPRIGPGKSHDAGLVHCGTALFRPSQENSMSP